MSTLADWARYYSSCGFTPVRLAPNSKRPIDAGWQTATFGPDEAAALATGHAGNLGISPGPELVVLDLDRKNGADGVATVAALEQQHGPLPPTLTQRTPSNGEHRVFRLPPGVVVRNGVGVAPGVDIRARGGQIVAYPSTLDGRAWQWVDAAAPIAPLPALWVQLLAPGSQRTTAPLPAVGGGGIPEGSRNAALTRRAGAMRAAGVGGEALALALQAINADECDPPLPAAEVTAIASSVGRYPSDPEPWQVFRPQPMPAGALCEPPGRARRLSLAHLATQPLEPHRFVIADILPAGVVTLLGGHGGAGKSMLALTAAVCMTMGRKFMGMATERCRVVFFSAEDPAPVVQRRVAKLCRRMQVDPVELDRWLLVLDATEAPTLYDGRSPQPALEGLRAEVTAFNPGAIVIDNASDTFDSNEIERARVREFVRLLAALGKPIDAAVLLLAHVDKATVKSGSTEGYSGSTAWHNSARSRLFLTTTDSGDLKCEHQKSNLGPRAQPFYMRWSEEGALDHVPPPGGVDDAATVLRILGELEAAGDLVPSAPQANPNAHKLMREREGFPRNLAGSAFWSLLGDLKARGQIAETEITDDNRKRRKILRSVRPVQASAT